MAESVPVSLATIAIGITFGVVAAPVIGTGQAIVMSAIVWAGGAQFAAIGVVAAGGTPVLAAMAGASANARFLPMGFAIAPSASRSFFRRLGTGAVLTDATFILARRDGGARFDRSTLVWGAPLQYAAWVGATAIGAVGASALDGPERLGLDAFIPVFFLGLLVPEVFRRAANGRRYRLTKVFPRPAIAASLAAAVTLGLTPFVPPGIPVLGGAMVALIGLWPPRRRSAITDEAAVRRDGAASEDPRPDEEVSA
ncbi:AzlC family ABC transporter permease [Gordonia soli]|uniref:AzlC family protein n=1 Tax=Gordonia soli NBRC 108243 TaxID=1223545 RepID=M0QR82_9ACTN|nr:AzlC family ABC transporter permease [Gordonia soli]GAC70909.1 AzlC family protein [Gordonia soli NBRC 108243]